MSIGEIILNCFINSLDNEFYAKYCIHIMIDDTGFIYHIFTNVHFKLVFSTRSKHELRIWMDLMGSKIVSVSRYHLNEHKSAYLIYISS